MSVAYKYTATDRLDTRCHYMYTPFEGPQFIEAYLEDRRGWLEHARTFVYPRHWNAEFDRHLAQAIREHLDRGAATSLAFLQDRSFAVLPARPRTTEFVTKEVLRDLWQSTLQPGVGNLQRITTEWIDCLVQRFEITKRLYGSYSSTLRALIKEHRDADLYVLLGGLCIDRYQMTRSLKYLNVTLKLVDLMVSLALDQLGPISLALGDALVAAEVKVIRKLAGKHAIQA